MAGKFCPKCGKQDVDFIGLLCVDCCKRTRSFVKFPDKIELIQCKHCNSILINGKWSDFDLGLIKYKVRSRVKTELKDSRISINFFEHHADISVSGKLGDNEIQESKEVPYNVRFEKCENCLSRSARYWEFKIQLRRADPFDIVKYNRIQQFLEDKCEWTQGFREGIDFLFVKRGVGEELMRRVRGKYHVRSETSKQFYGLTSLGAMKIRYTHCVRV